MAVNQKLENTSKACSRSSHGPMVGCSAMYCSTLTSLRLRCGSRAPGIARQRQQEQQHQRGAHRRQRAPGVARQREQGHVRHIGNLTSLTNASRTQDTKSFHTPVTSAAPTRISSTPPKIWMPRVCRRSQPRPCTARAEPKANSTNGIPRPRQ